MTTTDKIIEKYLRLSGKRKFSEFAQLHIEAMHERDKQDPQSRNYHCLEFICKKLVTATEWCLSKGGSIDVEITDTKESIAAGYSEPKKETPVKKAPKKKSKKGKDGLGKLVDHGKVSPRGNSDIYWGREGIDLVFVPTDEKVRIGEKVESSYKYYDMRFLENYYGLRAFEFGNWLSQQDRTNYLSGLGLALYDLYPLLGFAPEKISLKGKLAVAFGARGRGKALAHFEPGSFTINLTRYSRPAKVKIRPKNFKRVNQILSDGGVGSFAHEYGHALDYFGGIHVEKGDTLSLSGDDSTDPKPDTNLLKKNTLRGLMEKLMFKIIWKTNKIQSEYYKRLLKATQTKYYIQRNEIFARAFEVYVHYKLAKKKHKNIFLNKVKYNTKFYLTIQEMKRIEPEFDALLKSLKKHL